MSEKVLVIQTAFIGDAILTLPMIQELKNQNGDRLIDIICTPSSQEIFESSKHISKIIVLDKKNKHKSFISLVRFARKIRKKNYDKIFSPHRSFRTSLIVLLSGVRNTYGFDTTSLSYAYRNIIKYNQLHHEVQRNLSLIGFDTANEKWKIKPEISITDSLMEKVIQYKNSRDLKNFISIAPGSVWNTKCYPKEAYINIVDYFIERSKKVVLIGGGSDLELCNEIASGFPKDVFNVAGKFSIVESIAFLLTCDLLISNDSAPTHMGMCADIPVLTIYCSTVPRFGFSPYNNRSSVIGLDDLDCKPCGIHGYNTCPIKTFECGVELKPESVIKMAEEMVK